MPDSPPQLVVCAAIRNTITGEIVIGVRHFDPFMHRQIRASNQKQGWHSPHAQGFVDQWGKFLAREEALAIATANNQIRKRCGGDNLALFSDNLY